MQELQVVERLFPLVLSGHKTFTIRWREARIQPGLMTYICEGSAAKTALVLVTKCTDMRLSDVAPYVGKEDEWSDDVMLQGMREHYPNIALEDVVQVIEHLTPKETRHQASRPPAEAQSIQEEETLMEKQHSYNATITWTGADQGGTVHYKSYSRAHRVELPGKTALEMTADPAFLGDAARLNPEECLLVALSSCHMLSYLAFASLKGLEVVAYRDSASGTMIQQGQGGRFSEVVLRPEVILAAGSDEALAEALHETANEHCFIANSVNFPVRHEAQFQIQDS